VAAQIAEALRNFQVSDPNIASRSYVDTTILSSEQKMLKLLPADYVQPAEVATAIASSEQRMWQRMTQADRETLAYAIRQAKAYLDVLDPNGV
jgi:hypothetical protein